MAFVTMTISGTKQVRPGKVRWATFHIWTIRSFGETGYHSSPRKLPLNFDCDGDGHIRSTQTCLQYWNIRAPSYVAPYLAAQAAPSLGGAFSIYDKTIAFRGLNGNLQYVTVPMKGDVNQDGVVDGVDKTIVVGCLGKVLKGTTC